MVKDKVKSKQIKSASVSVIGLGRLGAPLAVTFALRGFKVTGIDVVKKNIAAINSARSHLDEPQYAQLLKKHQNNISATTSFKRAVKNSTITFIVVPTPSKRDGSFSNKYVLQAIKQIGKAIREKDGFHLVAVVSTISPGSMQNEIRPVLEKISGKQCGESIGLCYNPTFIALGNVIDNLLRPDFILIGEIDQKSGKILEKFYQVVCQNKPPIRRMNLINAEIAKLALNTFVTTKISYANMLSQLCDQLPGADASIVTNALGLDSRIGPKYLRPGPPYGGPCFPRDNRALSAAGKKVGIPLPLAQATDTTNSLQLKHLLTKVVKHAPRKGKVSLLGLAYKDKTDVIDESVSITLAKLLVQKGLQVSVYDPRAKAKAKKVLGQKVSYSRSLKASLTSADVVVIATPAGEFKKINAQHFASQKKPVTIIDCWRLLPSDSLPSQAKIIYLGKAQWPKIKNQSTGKRKKS